MLSDIRVVLVQPSHPGNIGASARAMKNMGLSRLYLVRPKVFPSAEATAMASGADDVLAAATVCDTLEQALHGCGFVVGASARTRRLPWPALDPRECAQRVVEERERTQVALVFGREKSGLTNDELERCHYLVTIPGNPEYRSLNLAAAVQIIAYEVFTAAREPGPDDAAHAAEPPATADDMEQFYAHLQRVLIETGFLDPDNPRHLIRRLRRLFNRARPDKNEVNILRGILTSVETKRGS